MGIGEILSDQDSKKHPFGGSTKFWTIDFRYAPTSNGAEDYLALAGEVLNPSLSAVCSDLPSMPLTQSAPIAMSAP